MSPQPTLSDACFVRWALQTLTCTCVGSNCHTGISFTLNFRGQVTDGITGTATAATLRTKL